jgi:hypothetical protein
MNRTAQRVCIWCGPVMLVVWLAGQALAGFIVPVSPSSSAHSVQRMLEHHTDLRRAGLVLILLAAALLVPWCAAIAAQMRRIEGPSEVLASTQMALGALLALEFLISVFIWMTALYRPTALDPAMARMLDDMGWLQFVGQTSTPAVLIAAVAFAVFLDKRARPIFPRWFGWLSVAAAVWMLPGSVIFFFKHGPLAWNGVMVYWLPLTAFLIWQVAMTVLLLRAVDAQAREEQPPAPAARAEDLVLA